MDARIDDHEARLREAEKAITRLSVQLEPLLLLANGMQALEKTISNLNAQIATLKGQALLLGAIATVVAPVLCGVVMKLLGK